MTQKDEALRMADDFYYIQRVHSQYLGNAPVWWAVGDNGYTSYIQNAKKFTLEEATELITNTDKYAMYKCKDIDARLHLVFDHQDFKNLGTDAPCGFIGGKYALSEPETVEDETLLNWRIDNSTGTELADTEKAALQAQVNELRELVVGFIAAYEIEGLPCDHAQLIIDKTAPQCLIQHDNEVIEHIINICRGYWTNVDCIAAIRALKG